MIFFLRLVHVGKALQDQRWLLQNLMAHVEEKRSAMESTAKQVQGRYCSTSSPSSIAHPLLMLLMLTAMLVKPRVSISHLKREQLGFI